MLGGNGTVAVITAPDGGVPATARIAAFRSEMAARFPGVTVEGADAVDQAVSAVADKKVVPYISTPMIAITPGNMNDPGIKPYIYDGTCTSSLRGFMTSGD
jgi:hypothetical protein